MELTKEQQTAIKIAVKRFTDKEPYTCIAGFAGTGKSTSVKYIIEALNVDPADVAFTSYTGKATQVLKEMGNTNTFTTHQLMYKAKRTMSGKFIFSKRPVLNGAPKLVIVDEISMLPKSMWDLLLSYNVPVIALGDPYQLPPVSAGTKEDHHVLDHPHAFLSEIHRQARDNEIIYNSMLLREGKQLQFQNSEHLIIAPLKELSAEIITEADQVLCATNKTRHYFNDKIRKLLKFGEEIAENDRLICVSNYWRFFSTQGEPIMNGTIGKIRNIHTFDSQIIPGKKIILGDFLTNHGQLYQPVDIDHQFLHQEKPCITYEEAKRRNINWLNVPKYFLFAYAITVHKAQGTSWPNILVTEERFPFNKEEHSRWLYTALTRASNKCTIIRNY